MNRAVSYAIGLAVLGAVALVTYRIVDDARSGTGEPPAAPAPGPAGAGASGGPSEPVDDPQRTVAEADTRLTGLVLQPDGAPAPDATVILYRRLSPWPEWEREEIERANTSDSGEFTFGAERGPDLIVRAEHPDHAAVEITADSKDPRIAVRLLPGFDVAGLVRDGFGAAVSGCDVILEPTLADTRRAVVTKTNAGGYFRFRNVRPGGVRVVARDPLYQPAVLPLVTVGASIGLELRLEQPALRLKGRVVSAANTAQPIVGAEVRAYPNTVYGGLFIPTWDITDRDGRFELRGLGRGNLRLEVRHGDYSTASRPVAVSPSSAELLFELGARSAVHGRLVGTATEELLARGDRIVLMLRNTAGDLARTAVAPDGSFAIPGTFSSGPATLEVDGGTLAFERTSGADVPIRIEDALRTDLELATVQPSVIVGRVIGPDGEHLNGARLWISQQYQRLPAPARLVAVTDAEGRFRITGLPSADLTLRVAHDSCASRREAVSVPAPGQTTTVPDILLQRAGGISGRVSRGQRALPGALVLATSGSFSATTVADRNGRYELRDLPPDTYRVRARYSTLRLALSSQKVVVGPGEVVPDIDVRFQPGRTVTGTVLGGDDEPLDMVTVAVRGMAGAGSIVNTDGSGNFTIEVPQGEAELIAYAGDRGFQSVTVIDAKAERVTLRLDMPPTASLIARVYGLPGRQRVPGGVLRVKPLDVAADDVTERTRRTIPATSVEMSGGELRFLWCPAGRVRLTLQCEGYAPFVKDLDLPPREEWNLGDILLEPGNTVSGVIADTDGRPIAGALVYLGQEIDRDVYEPQNHSDPEGRFSVTGVTSDALSLVVVAPNYAPRIVTLRLPQDVLRADPLPVVLERGSTIQVQASRADGRPWEGGFVLMSMNGQLLTYRELDASGTAQFHHRGPGSYQLKLFGNEEIRNQVEVVESGQTYEVALRPGK